MVRRPKFAQLYIMKHILWQINTDPLFLIGNGDISLWTESLTVSIDKGKAKNSV